jgi:ribosomal protein S28E/S33
MENDIKKIEIITDSTLQKKVVEAVDETGVSGYTIIKDVKVKMYQKMQKKLFILLQ